MVSKILVAFLMLVFVFYLMEHSQHAIGILQMIVDAARNLASGVSNLDLKSGGNK